MQGGAAMPGLVLEGEFLDMIARGCVHVLEFLFVVFVRRVDRDRLPRMVGGLWRTRAGTQGIGDAVVVEEVGRVFAQFHVVTIFALQQDEPDHVRWPLRMVRPW